MKKKILYGITVLIVGYIITTVSCRVFNPDFLVGTWIGSGKYGDTRISFTKDTAFSAVIYDEKGNVEKISGSYTAGYSILQLSFNGENRTVAYTLYRNSMDFIWKGSKIRLFRFK